MPSENDTDRAQGMMEDDMASPAARRDCAKRVFSGERWDMRGHMCTKPAKIEADGKWWCAIHVPDAEAARKKKLHDKWQAESAANQRHWALQSARGAIADIAIKLFRQQATHEDLERAVAAYERLASDSERRSEAEAINQSDAQPTKEA